MNPPQSEAHMLPPPRPQPHPSSPLSAPPPSPAGDQGQVHRSPNAHTDTDTRQGGSTELVRYGAPMPPSGQGQQHQFRSQEYEINIPRIVSSFPSPGQFTLPPPPPSPSHRHQPQPVGYYVMKSQSTDLVRYGDIARDPQFQHPAQGQAQADSQAHIEARAQAQTQTQTQDRSHAQAHAQDRSHAQVQAQAQAQAQEQVQVHTQASNQPQLQSQPQVQAQSQNQGSTPKTPRRNPFAIPPPTPTHSPHISSSPGISISTEMNTTTPDRPTDPPPQVPTSCPGASSRIKQSQPVGENGTGTGGEITYKFPPPAGSKVLVKRGSKGVSGGFKVPWAHAQSGNENSGESMDSIPEDKTKKEVEVGVVQKDMQPEGQKGKEREVGPDQIVHQQQQQQQQRRDQQQKQGSPSKESGAQKRAQAVLQAVAADQQSTMPESEPVPQAITAQNQDQNQDLSSRATDTPALQSRSRPYAVNYDRSDQVQRMEFPQAAQVNRRVSPTQHAGHQQDASVTTFHQDKDQVRHGRPRQEHQQQQQPQSNGPVQQPQSMTQYQGGPIQQRAPNVNAQGYREDQSSLQHGGEGRQYPRSMQDGSHQMQVQTQIRARHAQLKYRQPVEGDVFGSHPAGTSSNSAHLLPQLQHHPEDTRYPDDQTQAHSQTQGHHTDQNQHQGQGQGQEYAQVQEAHTPKHKSSSKSKRSRESREHRESKSSPQDRGQEPHQHKRSKHDNGSRTPHTSSPVATPVAVAVESQTQTQMEMNADNAPESSTQVEEEENEFDAYAEYDHVKELEEPWNEMMDEMVPFIDEWAEKYLSTTMDTIYGVYGCFYNMSTKNAESLEQGVKDIRACQETQNETRETLLDFRKSVAHISVRLSDGPGGSMGGRRGQSGGGTPGSRGRNRK